VPCKRKVHAWVSEVSSVKLCVYEVGFQMHNPRVGLRTGIGCVCECVYVCVSI